MISPSITARSREVGEHRLDDLREVSGHRLLVAAADLDLVAVAEDDRAEAVPLGLVELAGRDVARSAWRASATTGGITGRSMTNIVARRCDIRSGDSARLTRFWDLGHKCPADMSSLGVCLDGARSGSPQSRRWSPLIGVLVVVNSSSNVGNQEQPLAKSTPTPEPHVDQHGRDRHGDRPGTADQLGAVPGSAAGLQRTGRSRIHLRLRHGRGAAGLAQPRTTARPSTIALARARAANQTDRIGSLADEPGWSRRLRHRARSPDIAGTDAVRDVTQPIRPGRLRPARRRPLVPGQVPVHGQDEDAVFAADPDPEDAGRLRPGGGAQPDDRRPTAAQKYGDQLALFSTEQSARDIDALRQGVGDAKTNYLGFSYGTLLGATYAQLFPKNIRAMVLDGAIDPKQGYVAGAESQAAGFEHAFDNFATWCKAEHVAPARSPTIRRARCSRPWRDARNEPDHRQLDGRKATAGMIMVGGQLGDVHPAVLAAARDRPSVYSSRATRAASSFSPTPTPSGSRTAPTTTCSTSSTRSAAPTPQNLPTLTRSGSYQARVAEEVPAVRRPMATGMISCVGLAEPARPLPDRQGRGCAADRRRRHDR